MVTFLTPENFVKYYFNNFKKILGKNASTDHL